VSLQPPLHKFLLAHSTPRVDGSKRHIVLDDGGGINSPWFLRRSAVDWFNDKPFEGKGNTIQVSVAERKVLMTMT
jgi:hypothetical protein